MFESLAYAGQTVAHEAVHPVHEAIHFIAIYFPGGWWGVGGLLLIGAGFVFKKRFWSCWNWFIKDHQRPG